VNLLDEGQEIVLNLRHLQLRPHPCYRDGNHIEPVNLYHKVGHGKLDMYIISPAKDNREIKEFLSKWNANDPRLFAGRKEGGSLKDFHFPLQNLVSICALLVWQPANPNDNITRILFPGSTPQHKIFEGLDKLKNLEFLKYPVCTARSISPSASTVGIASRASSKQRSAPAVIEKLLPGEGVKAVSKTIGPTTETNKQVIKAATIPVAGHMPDTKQIKPVATATPISAPAPPPLKTLSQTKQKADKLTSKTEPPKMKTELNKSLEVEKSSAKTEKVTKLTVTELSKSRVEPKPKSETKTSISKSKTDAKAPRSVERKSQKTPIEKKSDSAKSSPTTPKKSVEGKMNGVATKAETAKLSRTSIKGQPSPTTTPAKSTKEANNRKVVESKYQHVSRMSSTSRGTTTKMRRKEQQETTTSTKAERKPISRRPKPGSPSKATTSGSPAKSSSAKSTPTPSVKSDKDGIIRKVKGEADRITTDSSAVSTPSTVDPDTAALKVKAAEVSEATTAIPEPEKLRKEEEEKVPTDNESEMDKVQPEQGESVVVCERPQMAAAELPVGEIQVHKEDVKIEDQAEKVMLPTEAEGPMAEAEVEEELKEDKESEGAEEMELVKQAVLKTYDTETTEEEKTEDVEEEEGEEELQHIDGKKSLADELGLESKEHKEIKVQEEEEEEEEEEEDEEDEYLIIEKEEVEQYMEDSLQDQESVESHVPEELEVKDRRDEEEEEEDEGELHKHLRDEAESEKEKKHDLEVNGFREESQDVIQKEGMVCIEDKEYGPLVTEEKEEEISKKPVEKPTEIAAPEKLETLQTTEEVNKDDEAEKEIPTRSQDEVAVSKEISAETKEQIQEEVQEIITSAKEIVTKTKQESEIELQDTEEGSMIEDKKSLSAKLSIDEKKDTEEEEEEIKEASSISPEEKLDISSEKNREVTDDTRDTDQKLDEEEGAEVKAADQKYPAEESQPDERFSTTVESAATTAPTLPEDERIPLDEIKEIVEEKYVKEETKEEKQIATAAVQQRLEQPTTLPQVVVASGFGMFDPMVPQSMVHLQRDIVKTPDEVADLPVHEEVDAGMYDTDEFSRDFKSKDDSAKKHSSQQELQESRQESPEFDMKGKLQTKYDDNVEKPSVFQDSESVDQEKAQIPVTDKDETKRITETESRQKTEESETPVTDFVKDADMIGSIEMTHDVKEDKDYLRDEKDVEYHILATEEAVKTEEIHKLSATIEAVPKSDVINDDKTEVQKAVPEEMTEHFIKSDTENGKAEGPLEEEIDGSTLVVKDGIHDAVKPEITELKESVKSVLETKDESVCQQEEKKEPSIPEFKSAEVSSDEIQMLDSKDEVKHMTEQFIERESHAVKAETLETDRQEEKLGVSETTKQDSSKIELEAITAEKTGLEEQVPEESKDKDETLEKLALEISEAEKFELECMELKETGKEQKDLERSVIKTELIKESEEANQSEKTLMGSLDTEKVLVLEGEFLSDVRPEESVIKAEPEEGKTDAQQDQFEDEELEKDSQKLDKGESVTKEPASEKTEDFVLKPEELSKTDTVAEVCEHPRFDDVVKQSEIHIESSEAKETSEPSKIDIIESEELGFDGGHTEEKVKETVAVKEKALTKEGTTFDEEKDIDEKDKPSKDLSLKSDSPEEDQTDTSKLSVDYSGTEVPTLIAEGESGDKPSPGTLSMTYVEIIDKLQRDSQKMEDSTGTSAEKSLPLMEHEKDVSEVEHKERAFVEQDLDILSTDDYKTDEKAKEELKESVTEIHSSKETDMKSTESIPTTSEVVYDKAEGQLTQDVQETDKVDTDETVKEEPLMAPHDLKHIQDSTECIPGISKEEYSETKTDSAKSKDTDMKSTESILTTSEVVHDKAEGQLTQDVQATDKVDTDETVKEEPLMAPHDLKHVQDSTECIPGISKEEHSETETDSAKSSTTAITETKSDQVSDACKLEESTAHLPQLTHSEDMIEGDAQKRATDDSIAEVEKSNLTVDKTDIQAEMKQTDDKDDSYGDGSISPCEVYVDSGLEEEPIYGKLEAAEVAEFVTVTPDSPPPSPRSQKDKKLPPGLQDGALQQEQISAVKVALEDGEKFGHHEGQQMGSSTFHEDIGEAKHESPDVDLASDKCDGTTDATEETQDLVVDTVKEEIHKIATADMPIQIPSTATVSKEEHDIIIIPSSDEVDQKLGLSTSKMQEIGEANVLDDLVSASTSAIAEIADKISTQVEEILTAPRKEEFETKLQIQESKSEVLSDTTRSTDDKGLTGTSHLSEEEVIRASAETKDEREAKSPIICVTEDDEMTQKTCEEFSHEAKLVVTGADDLEEAHGSLENKQQPPEEKSLKDDFAETSVTKEAVSLDHEPLKSSNINGIYDASTPPTVISEEVSPSVKSEIDALEPVKSEDTHSKGMEQSTVTATKEITVASTTSGSDPTHMETSNITISTTSEESISKTFSTGTGNGDMHIDNHEYDDSTGDREESSKSVTKMTKELKELDDDIQPGEKEIVEEFTTQETGEDGKIVTKTVKTTRTFARVGGEESDDSDFEDEDNIESTAAEDGSDSSRISKITASFTAVTKVDDDGVRCLSAGSTATTCSMDPEIVTKLTTTSITTAATVLSDDEANEIVTATTTKESIPEVKTATDDDKDVELPSKQEEFSETGSTDSGKLAELSKESSPLKVATANISHSVPAEMDAEKSVSCLADGTMKEEEKGVVNGTEGDEESRTGILTSVVGKSAMGDMDEASSVSGVHVSVKMEVPSSFSELTRTATPGSDALSDRDIDIGCGPSTPHSDISSGQVSRAAMNAESSEGQPESRHCDSDNDDDDDEPGSPLSVTSQLAHSPPSNFYFEMGDRNMSEYDHTSMKQKEVVPSAMTSSLYGSLPPDPLQELTKEEKETESHMSSSHISETPVRYSADISSGESVMMSSFYGSLEEDKKGTESIGVEHLEEQLREDEQVDFERAKHEHRAARGMDLAPTGPSSHSESTSSSRHITSKYEQHYMSGINGQKQKDDISYEELTEGHGNGNIVAGGKKEDILNQSHESKEKEYNGKTEVGLVDPPDSEFHQEVNRKETEHISANIPKDKKDTTMDIEHDPMLQSQGSAQAVSALSFPDPPQGFTQSAVGETDDKKKDPIADWGKPLGLPAPAPPPTNNINTVCEVSPGTPKKEKKVMQSKRTLMMNESNKAASGKDGKTKRPESPVKQPSSERKGSSNKEGGRNTGGGKAFGSPIYIDLTYVPHHGNSYYTTLEFFKKVRARYYVFSGTEPSREVYNALLDAKQTWEDKELGNSILVYLYVDSIAAAVVVVVVVVVIVVVLVVVVIVVFGGSSGGGGNSSSSSSNSGGGSSNSGGTSDSGSSSIWW